MSKFRKLILETLHESIIKCDIPDDSHYSGLSWFNRKINILKNPYDENEIINFLKNNTKTGEARVFNVDSNTYYADASVLTHYHLLEILKYNDIVDEQAEYKDNGEINLNDFNVNDDLSILNLSDLYHQYVIIHNDPSFIKTAIELGLTNELDMLHYIYSDKDMIENTPDDYNTFVDKYKNLLNNSKRLYNSLSVHNINNISPETEKLINFYWEYIIQAKHHNN